MKKHPIEPNDFTPQEARLMAQLRDHPERMARIQSLMEIVHQTEGPLKTADEVEELLIAEMRQLGNLTLRQWAIQAEERVSTELRSQDPTLRSRKKKR